LNIHQAFDELVNVTAKDVQQSVQVVEKKPTEDIKSKQKGVKKEGPLRKFVQKIMG
jgi:hypothetical protein